MWSWTARPCLANRAANPGGAYAGLSVRFAKGMNDSRLVTTEGPAVFADGIYRGTAMGMDYSGRFADRKAGIAILDSPGNLNSPTPWYTINNGTMNYFSPAVIQHHFHVLKAGQTLRLQYRLIIHPGLWSAGRLRLATKQFNSHKKS